MYVIIILSVYLPIPVHISFETVHVFTPVLISGYVGNVFQPNDLVILAHIPEAPDLSLMNFKRKYVSGRRPFAAPECMLGRCLFVLCSKATVLLAYSPGYLKNIFRDTDMVVLLHCAEQPHFSFFSLKGKGNSSVNFV